jgi:hypothetical protein
MGKKTKRKVTMRELQAMPKSKVGAPFGLRSAYLRDGVHKGSEVWVRFLEPKQEAWVAYLGFDSFEEMPVAHQELVKLWITNWIVPAFYSPQDVTTSMTEVRKSLSALERITKELMAMRGEKKVETLQGYVERKYSGTGVGNQRRNKKWL